MRLSAIALAIFGLAAVVLAEDPANCHGAYNTIPVTTAAPTWSTTVTNGKRFTAGAGNDTFSIVHLWGTSYEMGFAQGQLLKKEISALEADFTSYIESMLEQNLKKYLPQWLIDLIAQYGAPLLLDLTYDTTAPFSPASYLDEMQGVADGANVSVKFIRRLNMFPEMTKAACTIVGANGPATPTGTINHLRGLDFDPTVPFKDYAQVTVYHGTGKGNKIANFGWAGMIGALTGISDRSIGIGEKVWINHPKGVMGTAGQPWMSILRDVLYTDNITQALDTIQNAHKTCAIHVGVGDSTTNTFRGVRMAEKYFAVFNDTSINYTQHPALKGIVYWDKHAQPSHDPCLANLLEKYYGNITAETLALGVSGISRTGDLHSVAFDYQHIVAYVANARKTFVTPGSLDAYNRQFTRLNVKALFAEKPPN